MSHRTCLARPAGRIAAALLFAVTSVALAQEDLVADWERKMTRADEQLRAGDYKKARRAMRDLLAEMTEVVGTGAAAEQLVGRATSYLAVAESGLREDEAALWDWQVAGALSPALATVDPGTWGEAGRRLGAASAAAAAVDSAPADGAPAPTVRKKGRAVAIPLARLVACAQDPAAQASAAAHVTVGLDGRPRSPRLDPADRLLSRAALEALRTWTFEPAVRDGRAAEATFTLVTTLESKHCRDLLATRRPPRGGGEESVEEE